MTSNLHDSERSVPAPVWLLPLAMLGLLAGMWAGLLRMGWAWPVLIPTLPMMHGPLMVGGFLGTVIGLERAVGTGKRWAYAAPILTGAGTIALLVAANSLAGPLLITAGQRCAGRRAVDHLSTAACALHGHAGHGRHGLAGRQFPLALRSAHPAGRALVGRFSDPDHCRRTAGIEPSAAPVRFCQRLFRPAQPSDARRYGAFRGQSGNGHTPRRGGYAGPGALAARYDIARRRIKAGGQARFIAICLLTGYVWLGFGGLLAMRYGGLMAGPQYDAYLHAIFLGFVFSMIFGHALIIFPALLHVQMVYRPWLYSHLILLNLTLALRVAGDLIPYWPARMWGGLLNVLVLLLFLVNTVTSIRRRT